ncbi:hypothetical protein [Massilia aerilata]|uniref:DUF1648 domain-containing protein n=1 Tax=Massilia aerilata TaxID=453817 RepID=A0ABW0RQ43_9BURK
MVSMCGFRLQGRDDTANGRRSSALSDPGVRDNISRAVRQGLERKLMHRWSRFVLNGMLVAAMFALAFLAIYSLPAGGQVATHWGPDSRPDAWVGGSAIHLINPIVALVVWFLASNGKPPGTAQARVSNVLLIQLVIQLSIALYARGAWS